MSIAHRAVRTIRKLRGRTPDELRERGAQALAVWLERARLRDAAEPSGDELRRLVADGGSLDPEQWLARFRDGDAPLPSAAFADPAATIAAVRRALPQSEGETLRRASEILRGRFDLLGHRGVSFGDPIDWHRDPVAGRRAPLVHWSRIPYLDGAAVGDHKLVWELNRHQFLLTLGRAYWFTGDERWARRIVEVLREWMDANPPKLGVNWASSLEVAFRAVSWIWALHFVRRSPSLDAPTFARALGFLSLHARHLERYLSTYFSPNTHLTGEALGLFYIGTFLPMLQGAGEWRRRGWEILASELPKHARPDGVYFEQATYYHRYTVDFYLHALAIGEATGLPAREAIAPHLERLVDHLVHLARADGTIPLIGDEDGGRLMYLDERAPGDVRGPIALGAVLFRRPDWRYVAGAPAEELVWLLGPEGVERFEAMRPREPRELSRGFPDGGFYVMRDGWDPDARHLVIDCGPHGMLNCGHAHADALAFELALGDQPVLVDPGTYSYTLFPEWRDHFRATSSHNTLELDGRSSSEMSGPFSWASIARSETDAWHAFEAGDWFEGHHDGYERLAAPAVHRRQVLHLRETGWVVRDLVESGTAHDVALTFQCGPDVVARPAGEGRVVLVARGRALLEMFVFAEGASVVVEDAWLSPQYGVRRLAQRVRVRAPGAARVTTLLLPADGGLAEVTHVTDDAGEGLVVARAGGRHVVRFGPGRVDGLESDARVAWARLAADGTADRFLVAGGGRLSIGGLSVAVDDGHAGAPHRGAAAGVREAGAWRTEGLGVRFGR